MGRLTCPCLNVSVHYKGGSWDSRPVAARRLFPEGSTDRLSGETVCEVELDVAGVTMAQKSLVVVRTVGDWVIRACTNCDTDVYILHTVKESRVFATKSLLSTPEAVTMATQSSHYSPVFGIILRRNLEDEDDQPFQRRRVSSMTFGREDPVMKLVHAQMKSFLNREQEAMEEKIRRYEEQQREAFSQLQKRAHRDRALLFTAIARARQGVIADAMADTLTINPRPRPFSKPSGPSPPKSSSSSSSGHPSPEQQRVTITLKDPKPFPSKPHPSKGPHLPSDDTMFSLEGFDYPEAYEETDSGNGGGGVLFPQSDDEDEEISTDDSSYRDVSALNTSDLPSSVPVSVPMFRRSKTTEEDYERGSPHGQFTPSDVGNSIKALALSVQDTGMFGDLPRPRIMTKSYGT